MNRNDQIAAEPFLGSWSLVSWTVTAADGQVVHPLGDDAWGRLMYLQGGQMAASLMRRRRTAFVSDNRLEATVPECEAAYREFLAYFGTFTVQSAAGTVTHHVEAATYPNWIGTDLVRSFQFSQDLLTLSLVSAKGAAHALTWKRAEEIR
ncbi:MAG: lipocalin-like domain-containing protein [Planctomycetaceae bacterium]